jgi:hypothetical protein
MRPKRERSQKQLSNFWEKVTGTFMLDPPSRATSKLATVESGDELSFDDIQRRLDEIDSSDYSTSDDISLDNDSDIKSLDEAPPSPWKRVISSITGSLGAVKNFGTMQRAPDLGYEEKEEVDESSNEDFQPFILRIKYPWRNSVGSELSEEGTANMNGNP